MHLGVRLRIGLRHIGGLRFDRRIGAGQRVCARALSHCLGHCLGHPLRYPLAATPFLPDMDRGTPHGVRRGSAVPAPGSDRSAASARVAADSVSFRCPEEWFFRTAVLGGATIRRYPDLGVVNAHPAKICQISPRAPTRPGPCAGC
jgi:hypothetical protein